MKSLFNAIDATPWVFYDRRENAILILLAQIDNEWIIESEARYAPIESDLVFLGCL